MLRSTWAIKGSIVFLILMTSIFIPLSYFEPEEISDNDESEQIAKIIFNFDVWENSHLATLLVGILSSSAAIVAVSFTITQIIVSNVSQKYSPKILDVYFKKSNPTNSFVALILTVGGAAALLSLYDSIPNQLTVIFGTIIVNGFLISILIFTLNFRMVFRVISPYHFMEDIKEMVFENMTSGDDD